jgi:hypothetical protein
MAVTTLNAVGFCAHYSQPGDWAFDYALRLARLHEIKLNVFHFLTDPYDLHDSRTELLSAAERAKLAIMLPLSAGTRRRLPTLPGP